jgi:hypothetical protein
MAKTTTRVLLNIPSEIAEETNSPTRVVLTWTPYHPAVRSKAGVVVSHGNEILQTPPDSMAKLPCIDIADIIVWLVFRTPLRCARESTG